MPEDDIRAEQSQQGRGGSAGGSSSDSAGVAGGVGGSGGIIDRVATPSTAASGGGSTGGGGNGGRGGGGGASSGAGPRGHPNLLLVLIGDAGGAHVRCQNGTIHTINSVSQLLALLAYASRPKKYRVAVLSARETLE